MSAHPKLTSEEQEQLVTTAKRASAHAYAPYSNFHVGAAILLETGEIFSGCNVENASYGLTNCAERSAIFAAVSVRGHIRIRAVAVVNDRKVACSPCGACRQVIAEFGPGAQIFYLGHNGIQESSTRELLPHSFTSDSLK